MLEQFHEFGAGGVEFYYGCGGECVWIAGELYWRGRDQSVEFDID
jgi:hypothetical protein